MGSGSLFKWRPTDKKLRLSGECPHIPPARSSPPGKMEVGLRSLVSRAPAQGSHLKSPSAEALLAMHECCGTHLKIKFPVTAGISGVPCCWLQLSHGRLVTSSAGLTMLSSKAGPMSLRRGEPAISSQRPGLLRLPASPPG